jgi:organic hydroperoxide reductase OsmC/OhrA
MSEHKVDIVWKRLSAGFSYDEYNRDHLWHFDSGVVVKASAAPQFLGSDDRTDPEEAFVASISSCHMLTFLAICARKRIVVDSYLDHAIGYLEKDSLSQLAVTRVELSPEVTFSKTPPTEEVLRIIHDQSHKECFIANSVKTEIVVLQ